MTTATSPLSNGRPEWQCWALAAVWAISAVIWWRFPVSHLSMGFFGLSVYGASKNFDMALDAEIKKIKEYETCSHRAHH